MARFVVGDFAGCGIPPRQAWACRPLRSDQCNTWSKSDSAWRRGSRESVPRLRHARQCRSQAAVNFLCLPHADISRMLVPLTNRLRKAAEAAERPLVKPSVEIRLRSECRCKFGIDDRIAKNRTQRRCYAELSFRPPEPRRIRSGDVQQYVRVEKDSADSSPRVRAITSAVVTPGRAAPRACFSQVSAGSGAARRARYASSQMASCSTCGTGKFSIAVSISPIVLMTESLASRP